MKMYHWANDVICIKQINVMYRVYKGIIAMAFKKFFFNFDTIFWVIQIATRKVFLH